MCLNVFPIPILVVVGYRAFISQNPRGDKRPRRGGRPGFARVARTLQLRDSVGLAPTSPFSPAIRGTGTSTEELYRQHHMPLSFVTHVIIAQRSKTVKKGEKRNGSHSRQRKRAAHVSKRGYFPFVSTFIRSLTVAARLVASFLKSYRGSANHRFLHGMLPMGNCNYAKPTPDLPRLNRFFRDVLARV